MDLPFDKISSESVHLSMSVPLAGAFCRSKGRPEIGEFTTCWCVFRYASAGTVVASLLGAYSAITTALTKRSAAMSRATTRQDRLIEVPAGPITLEGNLSIPPEARGIVLFAHGSGSSRHSPRNRHVAEVLREAGMATLLIDLLTA